MAIEDRLVKYSDAEIERLTKMYTELERDALMKIDKAMQKGTSTRHLKNMQKGIQEELDRVQKGARDWADDAIPKVYKHSMSVADEQAKQVGEKIVAGMEGLHTQAMKIMSDNAYQKLANTTQVVGRRADDWFRNYALEATRKSAAGIEDVASVARDYRAKLEQQGLTGFVDRSGREWNLRSYSEMVGQTTTMEAHLQGTANRLTEYGRDLVKVSSHYNPCPLCLPWEGRVLSITGQTEGYPTLGDAKGAGLFHPRCKHAYGLYLPELQDPDEYRRIQKMAKEQKPLRQPTQTAQRVNQKERYALVDEDGMAEAMTGGLDAEQGHFGKGAYVNMYKKDAQLMRSQNRLTKKAPAKVQTNVKNPYVIESDRYTYWDRRVVEDMGGHFDRLEGELVYGSRRVPRGDEAGKQALAHEALIKNGYDSILFEPVEDLRKRTGGHQLLVFDPDDVKIIADFEGAGESVALADRVRVMKEKVGDSENWDDMTAIGAEVRQEAYKKIDKDYKDLTKQIDDLEANAQDAYEKWAATRSQVRGKYNYVRELEIEEAGTGEEIIDAATGKKLIDVERNEYYRLRREAHRYLGEEQNFREDLRDLKGYRHALRRDAIKEELKGVRNFGPQDLTVTTRANIKKYEHILHDELENYPTEWLNEVGEEGRHFALHFKGNRGSYYPGEPVITCPKKYRSISNMQATMRHELMHHFQFKKKGLKQTEHDFYTYRTENDVLEHMGHGYGRDERTRPDKWFSKYAGKDYGDGIYEVLTMGMEQLFNDEKLYKPDFWDDEEHVDFMIGVLAAK